MEWHLIVIGQTNKLYFLFKVKRNFSLFSNFGVTRLCGLWLYYWYWPSQGSGYYQSASSPLLLTISQSLHSGEWGLFCHNFLFQLFNHHRHTPTSISMTVIQSLYEPSELFLNIIKIIIMDSRSYLSLWGVRRVSMRAEWFGPLGDRVETVGFSSEWKYQDAGWLPST